MNITEPWNMANVTPLFRAALADRRSRQATIMFKNLKSEMANKRILDYGCGQGAFVKFLLGKGMASWGCDLDLTNCNCEVPAERFVSIHNPWELPQLSNYDLVTMLDVLEHCPEPNTFLQQLRDSGVKELLIKVPMLFGPIGIASCALSICGRSGMLERLLLAGEISPHHSFFSLKGLSSLLGRSGFKVQRVLRFADVGKELPQRFRTPDGAPVSAVKAQIMTAAGFCLEGISHLWSDTAAVYAVSPAS